MTYQRSCALHQRAGHVLPGGVSTGFRAAEKPVPLFFERAEGSRLVDVDGNAYVDYVCGMGPIILGHSHPEVTEAVARAAAMLVQTGGQHEAEVELAERLVGHVPSFEMLRPSMSGSEAVHGAIRLARAATGRSVVVKFAGHYHGWLDGVLGATRKLPPILPESKGQPASTLAEVVALEWNDLDALRRTLTTSGDQIAAVIMEPYPCNGGVIPPAPGFVEAARELTRACGAVLIFDEVITGFRLGLDGAQGMLGVTPDLTVVAKAMANGVPIAAFGGRRDLMELLARGGVTHAGTYNAGGISVAAALALSAPASAQSRDPAYAAARASGAVGEKTDGYLGYPSAPSAEVRKMGVALAASAEPSSNPQAMARKPGAALPPRQRAPLMRTCKSPSDQNPVRRV